MVNCGASKLGVGEEGDDPVAAIKKKKKQTHTVLLS